MRHDIGNRLAMNREHNALAGPNCVNDLCRLVSKFTNANLHVLHDSTAITGYGFCERNARFESRNWLSRGASNGRERPAHWLAELAEWSRTTTSGSSQNVEIPCRSKGFPRAREEN